MYISIHALREEGDTDGHGHTERQNGISIHALREEGDSCICSYSPAGHYFYPRPPRGGRRRRPRASRAAGREISIHALREEGDARRR